MSIHYLLRKKSPGANPFSLFNQIKSLDAYELARRLKALSYQDFLGTNYWFAVSSTAKSEAGMRCKVCNQKDDIQVHHRTYEVLGFEHSSMMDLVVLCKRCHNLFHGHSSELPIIPQPPQPVVIKSRSQRDLRVIQFTESDVSVPDNDPVLLTRELIDSCRANGSFTNATIRALGVKKCDMVKGWVGRLVGTTMSRDKFKEARVGRFQYNTGPVI